MANRSYAGCDFQWAGYWYTVTIDRPLTGKVWVRRLRYGRPTGAEEVFERSVVERAERDGRFRAAVAIGK